jgi:hypothetical protein
VASFCIVNLNARPNRFGPTHELDALLGIGLAILIARRSAWMLLREKLPEMMLPGVVLPAHCLESMITAVSLDNAPTLPKIHNCRYGLRGSVSF